MRRGCSRRTSEVGRLLARRARSADELVPAARRDQRRRRRTVLAGRRASTRQRARRRTCQRLGGVRTLDSDYGARLALTSSSRAGARSHPASAPSCSTPPTRATSCPFHVDEQQLAFMDDAVRPRSRRVADRLPRRRAGRPRESRPARRATPGSAASASWRTHALGRRRGAHARPARAGERARRAAGLARGDRREHERVGRSTRSSAYRLTQDVEVWTLPAADGVHDGRGSPGRGGQGATPRAARALAARRRHPLALRRRARARHGERRDARSACAQRPSCSSTPASPSLCSGRCAPSGTSMCSTSPWTIPRCRCSVSSAARSSSASTRCCSSCRQD